MNNRQPPENTPEKIANHDVLVFALHDLMMPGLTKNDGSSYATLPTYVKKSLAKITGGCSRDWEILALENREVWWHNHYDNLRYFLGLGGRDGGQATQERMRIASEFWSRDQDEALSYAMTTFYNNDTEELEEFIESQMRIHYDDWRDYIMNYGEEFVQNKTEEEITEKELSQLETKSSQLNDSELAILHEINKLAQKIGGSPKRSVPINPKKVNKMSRFKIWAGIPGTGKSYNLKQELKTLLTDTEIYSVRTVFHPEYSNHDFIGQIKPEATDDGINYPFIPGPFTLALKKAYEAIAEAGDEEPEIVALVVEELNRGNASAIFGEIFQLLDIDEDGQSEYGIDNRDIARQLGIPEDEKIRIPSNMCIYATMNISDQNVFPLDTAFLRRWDREYTNANDWVSPAADWIINFSQGGISWKAFAEEINRFIVEEADDLGIEHPEDKRLGPWFIEQRHCDNLHLFANKVLVYLWTNVFTHSVSREQTFSAGCKTLEELLTRFLIEGTDVFNKTLAGNMTLKTTSPQPSTRRTGGRENLIPNVSEIIRRIIALKPTNLDQMRRARIDSVNELAKDRISESGGVLGEGYSSHIDSQIRRRFFNNSSIEPVNLEQFDKMIFEYISGASEEIIEKSSERVDQDGYSKFSGYLEQGRSDYQNWISSALNESPNETIEEKPNLLNFVDEDEQLL